MPVASHFWQSFGSPLPQAELQHTESTQVRPPVHMPLREHALPGPTCTLQLPVARSQNVPAAVQSASVPHAPWQAVFAPLQNPDAQGVVTTLQAPP